jgi:hypothetical protein
MAKFNRKKLKQNHCKTQPNMTKPWQISKTTYFHSWVDKGWDFWVVMVGEDSRFLEHLFSKANANPKKAKPTAEHLLKNQSSKHASPWVLLDKPAHLAR